MLTQSKIIINAIMLAAGTSSRMGRLKQLTSFGGVPMAKRTLDILAKSQVSRIVVVLGAQAEQVAAALGPWNGRIQGVVNDQYQLGMGTSLARGVKALGLGQPVLIALADLPMVSTELVDQLITSHQGITSRIVAPTWQGRRGHPVIFGADYLPELGNLRGDQGAAGLLKRYAENLQLVPTDCPGVVADIDTPEQLARWLGRKNSTNSGEDEKIE